jgi:hypothetical protein
MCKSFSHKERHPRLTLLHSQLRDLIICPDERGVVNYVQEQCIMEHDISDPSAVSLLSPLFSLFRVSCYPGAFRSSPPRGKLRSKISSKKGGWMAGLVNGRLGLLSSCAAPSSQVFLAAMLCLRPRPPQLHAMLHILRITSGSDVIDSLGLHRHRRP